MLRHLLQVNKKKGKRCRFPSDLIPYVSKSDNTAVVSLKVLAFHSNRPIYICATVTSRDIDFKYNLVS
jgi:hypothetical protein